MTTETACEKHVGSPDVHVDHLKRRIVLYFHGCRCPGDGGKAAALLRGDPVMPWDKQYTANQRTYVAWSEDGVNFVPVPTPARRGSPWRVDADFQGVAAAAAAAAATRRPHDSSQSIRLLETEPLGTEPLGAPYFRVFWWRGVCFAIGMPVSEGI